MHMGKWFRRKLKNGLRRIVLAVRRINDELDGRTGRVTTSQSLPMANYLHHDVYEDPYSILYAYNRSDWFSNKKAKLSFDDYGMVLSCGPGEMVYASYRETNCSYRIPGTGGFDIPEGKYFVNVQAKVSPGVGGRLLIHGYTKDGEKVELLRTQINEQGNLEVGKTCRKLRLSMQLWGSGRLQLNEISFLKVESLENAALASAGADTLPETFEGNVWYTSNSQIEIDDGELRATAEIGNAFLSYGEQNCKFTIPPRMPLELPYARTRVAFSGDADNGLEAAFTMIGYYEDEKKFVWQVPLNEEVEFMIPEDYQFRLAIQIKGKGGLRNIRFGFTEELAPKRALIGRIRRNAERIQSPPDRLEKNTGYKIGVIFDEFTFQCFQNEAEYVVLEPDMFQSQIEEEKVDFVLVESAWHGNGGKWDRMIADMPGDDDQTLCQLIGYCRENGIKTAFWNKEDPVNYEHFIDAARLFDYVFTTDAGIVPTYQKDCGHKNVFDLPFAANPTIHNPIGRRSARIGEVAFAGSWMAHKHPDRMMDMIRVLRPATNHDLCIFDRNYDKAVNNNYRFPLPYRDFIAGSLPFELMSLTYRMFDVFLNVNSVQKSPTMFSRRVFELLASGTAIVSGYSAGIDHLLHGLVFLSSGEEETEAALSLLIHSPELRERAALRGVREVMLAHTYRHRFQKILRCMELPFTPIPKPAVTFVAAAQTEDESDRLIASFRSQSVKEKQLILIYKGKLRQERGITLLRPEQYSAEAVAELARYGNVAFLDPACYYAPHYAIDLLAAKVYSGAGILGKCAEYRFMQQDGILELLNCEQEYIYTAALDPATILTERDLLGLAPVPLDGTRFDLAPLLREIEASRASAFAADRYNFCRLDGRAFNPVTDAVACFGGDYLNYVTV